MFGILTSLERILAIPDKPLDTVVNQLETQHRNAIMGLKVTRISDKGVVTMTI